MQNLNYLFNSFGTLVTHFGTLVKQGTLVTRYGMFWFIYTTYIYQTTKPTKYHPKNTLVTPIYQTTKVLITSNNFKKWIR